MKQNIGAADRLIRLFISILLALMSMTSQLNGTMATVSLTVAIVLFVTVIAGICPLYGWLGADTRFDKRSKFKRHKSRIQYSKKKS